MNAALHMVLEDCKHPLYLTETPIVDENGEHLIEIGCDVPNCKCPCGFCDASRINRELFTKENKPKRVKSNWRIERDGVWWVTNKLTEERRGGFTNKDDAKHLKEQLDREDNV